MYRIAVSSIKSNMCAFYLYYDFFKIFNLVFPILCHCRKALLQKMVVDPKYSKPHLNLHRTPATFDSPITPLRPPQPSLGEVGESNEYLMCFSWFCDWNFSLYTTPGQASIKVA